MRSTKIPGSGVFVGCLTVIAGAIAISLLPPIPVKLAAQGIQQPAHVYGAFTPGNATTTNASGFLIDSGSPAGGGGTDLYTFTVPVLTDFTICSQCGTVAATVTDTGSGITMGGSNNTTGAYDMATGSAPWRAAAYIQGVLYNESFQGFGLYCREASSGKAKQYIIQINGSANIAYNTFNTGFAYVSTPKATSIGALGLGLNAGGIWMSLYDDNTNLRWQISGDGTNWVTWNTEGRTTFATCDNVGITANGSTNYPPIPYYRSWALTH